MTAERGHAGTDRPARSISRRAVVRGALASPVLALPAGAATPKTNTIALIVGASPGSPTDRSARAFAPFLERHLPGIEIAVVNRPGRSGLVAFEALAAAPPDGRTLGWVATPALPARMVDCAAHGAAALLERLRLLAAVEKEPIVFVTPASGPIASARDLIARSAEAADDVPIATPAAGTPPHLAALRLQAVSGAKLNIVAFPSAPAARQAALDGNVAAAVLPLGEALEALEAGTLTGLGLAAANRASAAPDVPLLSESGLVLTASILRGVAGPAGLPVDVAQRLFDAMRAVAGDPEFVDDSRAGGFRISLVDGTDWTARTRDERAELTRLWDASPWSPTDVG